MGSIASYWQIVCNYFIAMRTISLNISGLVCLALILCTPIEAVDSDDFPISSDFGYAEQNNPSVAVGLYGKFAVAWLDFRTGNGDIYCQLFDSGAALTGDNFIVNDDGISVWQFEPELASDWYGNYYAVWKDYRNSDQNYDPDIYYQKLDSTGFVGNNLNISVEPPDSSHQSPSVVATGWGKSVVAWSDLRNRNWDIFVQALDEQGEMLGANIKVNDDLQANPQHEPAVGLSPEGWFVVVWYDGRNQNDNDGNDDIYLQKFDSSGNMIGVNIKVNDDDGITRQKFPAVTVSGEGVITVVWTDWRRGQYPANSDIFAQRFDWELNRLGPNVIVNKDGTYASQRDPRVAADRMGNICVVWSDSSGGNWNAVGQMIDNDGVMRDGNFPVNIATTGKQLHPDVALDGYFLYLVWADNRNGNYDIYGRILQYNDPALIPSPNRLEFTKDILDDDPASEKIELQNAGYGELDYRLSVNQSWIELSKIIGTTPDSFFVTINSDSLDYGLHQGAITLINLSHNDSTSIIPVLLTITGPLIEVSPDSISFNALVEYGDPLPQNIRIDNSGSGNLNWSVSSAESWLTLSPSSGSAGDIVEVGCEISSLISGDYESFIIISDDGALNAPESLKVNLRLQSNIVYLDAAPDSLYHQLLQGESYYDSVRILNRGGSVSDWQAQIDYSWVAIDPLFGSDNDFIRYAIETADLDYGRYPEYLVISDSNAFNNPFNIPFIIDICAPDTLIIPPSYGELGSMVQLQIYLHNNVDIIGGILSFQVDSKMLAIDSFLAKNFGSEELITAVIDSGQSSFSVTIAGDSSLEVIPAGQRHFGDLYLTANDSVEGVTYIEPITDADFFLSGYNGFTFRPYIENGGITISTPTSVEWPGENNLPAQFSLGQNFPNPFNSRTRISFTLKRSGPARLELYNILGQRVTSLVDEYLEAGYHTVAWNGRDEYNHQAASGIYFYKLISSGNSAVKKMVFLK